MYSLFLHAFNRHSIIIFKPYSAACRVISQFSTYTSFKRSQKIEHKGLDKALKILDLVIPKTSKDEGDACHHRLIQGCMQDILEVGQRNCFTPVKISKHSKSTDLIQIVPDKSCSSNESACWRTISSKEDPFLLFLELHKRGNSMDVSIFSSIMSICASTGALDRGVQLHALLVKRGYDMSIRIGSSLISLYSKCRQLANAFQVFQMMPVRNTVSWTAIIAGYAQHWQIETCLYLFVLMRQSTSKPNDVTFASLLSACTSGGYLGLGRSLHCLEIRMGFDLYVHVSNALISMYSKCGSIDEADYVFQTMPCRDLISWNSMISGYSQYGLGELALDLLKKMDKENIVPDAISFLGVLSSCRHAGLVELGCHCFDLMLEHGIKPELDHYSCIIDLLGRAGRLEEALDFIKRMPISPNAVIWGSLLSSCRVHGNVWIGIHAAESQILLEPGCAATYVQLANLYASVGYWNHVAKVRKLMKERGLKTSPGYSWIEIGNNIYRFKAEDRSNSQINDILTILDSLACEMEYLGCTPIVDFDLSYKGISP
ncbi:pentatricopeptide repeat-containing protein [Cocos nucifera]|uniref:Pentatricopeptide repeat-containing protein n=1 Tax=Cocos nucifera TaxID=13894 RepID=A0A8K0ITH3_COCNU|nr:pentatricopeptide repeat-containing protein [Cocos nucifera]